MLSEDFEIGQSSLPPLEIYTHEKTVSIFMRWESIEIERENLQQLITILQNELNKTLRTTSES